MDEIWFRYGLTHEKSIHFFCYLGVFCLMALWEWKASRRREIVPPLERWPHNLALTALNILIVRVLFPGGGLWAAFWARDHHLGYFNGGDPVPFTFGVFFTVIFLDWLIYYLHRAFHAVPWLWKFHRVHHTDPEMDITTGVRFHPAEAVISMGFKSLLIVLMGAPPAGVFTFEILLSGMLLFEHANISIPELWEKCLRLILVTPEMHRVHHSVYPEEYNRNFGFIFSWWDRALMTYLKKPKDGHERMRLGLGIFEDHTFLAVDQMLLQPFLDHEGRFDLKHFFNKD